MRKSLILNSYLVAIHIAIVVILLNIEMVSYLKAAVVPQNNLATLTYKKTHAFYKRVSRNISASSNIFIGDSHVQGLAVSEVANKAVNLGIGKDTIQGLTKRILDYDLLAGNHNLIIAIGVNNLWQEDVNVALAHFKKLLALIPDNTQIFVSAVFFVDENFTNLKNLKIKSFNHALKEVVLERDNAEFIDINNLMVVDGQLKAEYHIGDGIHLSKKGYDIWINVLNKFLVQ